MFSRTSVIFERLNRLDPPCLGSSPESDSLVAFPRWARTFVEDTSVTHITIRTQNEVGLFLRAGKRTKSGYYSKSIESNISGDSGATCSSEPERDDARALGLG